MVKQFFGLPCGTGKKIKKSCNIFVTLKILVLNPELDIVATGLVFNLYCFGPISGL